MFVYILNLSANSNLIFLRLVILQFLEQDHQYLIYPQLDLISGFSSKSVASGHFLDNRSKKMIEQSDNDIDKIDWATNKLDDKQKFVTSSVYGLKTRKALKRSNICKSEFSQK